MSSPYRYAPGATLGPWHLEAPLGRGGFSEVWRATRGAPGRWEEVALKVVVRPEHAALLRDEARSLALVAGRSIVRVLAHDLEHDPPWIALELLAGGDLRARLAAAGRLDPPAALSVAERALEVLARVHEHGVVHGDLKPENVLFDAQGRLLLADFGLSRRIAAEATSLSLSLSRLDETIAGTLDYVAPELREGRKPSPASDVYSAGVLLYELLTGRRPRGLFVLPGDLEPDVPPGLDRTVERALSPVPEERFSDAAALLGALREAVAEDREELPRTLERAAVAGERLALLPRLWLVAIGTGLLTVVASEGPAGNARALAVGAAALAGGAVVRALVPWARDEVVALGRFRERVERQLRSLS